MPRRRLLGFKPRSICENLCIGGCGDGLLVWTCELRRQGQHVGLLEGCHPHRPSGAAACGHLWICGLWGHHRQRAERSLQAGVGPEHDSWKCRLVRQPQKAELESAGVALSDHVADRQQTHSVHGSVQACYPKLREGSDASPGSVLWPSLAGRRVEQGVLWPRMHGTRRGCHLNLLERTASQRVSILRRGSIRRTVACADVPLGDGGRGSELEHLPFQQGRGVRQLERRSKWNG